MLIQDIVGVVCLSILGVGFLVFLVAMIRGAIEGDEDCYMILGLLAFSVVVFGALWGLLGWAG